MKLLRPLACLLFVVVASVALGGDAFAQVDPAPPVVPAPMNPLLILGGLSAFVASMPETIDGWLSSKFADNPVKLGLMVMLVGVAAGVLGTFFGQLADGVSLRNASIVLAVGTLTGAAKGFANWSKARAQLKKQSG